MNIFSRGALKAAHRVDLDGAFGSRDPKICSTFGLDSIYLNFLIKGGGGIKLKAYGSGQKEG